MFGWYMNLILCDKYILLRIVIKVGVVCPSHVQMLGDFLIDKINFEIMLRFVSSADNLKVFMNLLCSKYPTIQYDAFNVFKVRSRWSVRRRSLWRTRTSRRR